MDGSEPNDHHHRERDQPFFVLTASRRLRVREKRDQEQDNEKDASEKEVPESKSISELPAA